VDAFQRNAALRQSYGELFDQISAVLFAADPIRIGFMGNTEEYELEVGTILPRLRECQSAEDVQRVMHEEFVRWFDPILAGPARNYAEPATQIWQLWQQFLARGTFS
jgi:hypothetical protein